MCRYIKKFGECHYWFSMQRTFIFHVVARTIHPTMLFTLIVMLTTLSWSLNVKWMMGRVLYVRYVQYNAWDKYLCFMCKATESLNGQVYSVLKHSVVRGFFFSLHLLPILGPTPYDVPIKDFVEDLVQLRVSAQDEFGNTGVQELTFSICKHPHCLRPSLLHLWLNNIDALSTYIHKVKVFVYMWQP